MMQADLFDSIPSLEFLFKYLYILFILAQISLFTFLGINGAFHNCF